jgi:hypothetical protein
MTERFREAMRNPPDFSNADDPTADRLAAYPEAGELESPQGAADRDQTGPTPPQPAGEDSEVIFAGASGQQLGGPAATDAPGTGPGMPPPDGPRASDDAAPRAGDETPPRQGSFVDRLDR